LTIIVAGAKNKSGDAKQKSCSHNKLIETKIGEMDCLSKILYR